MSALKPISHISYVPQNKCLGINLEKYGTMDAVSALKKRFKITSDDQSSPLMVYNKVWYWLLCLYV